MCSRAPWITLAVTGSMRRPARAPFSGVVSLMGASDCDEKITRQVGPGRAARRDQGRAVGLEDDGGSGNDLVDRQPVAPVEAGVELRERAVHAKDAPPGLDPSLGQGCAARSSERADPGNPAD